MNYTPTVNSKNSKHSIISEEIDVVKLLAKGVMAARDNFKSLVLSIIIGAALGTIVFFLLPKRYSSRMIIQSDILTEAYAATITENLAQLLTEENSREVARKLGLTKEEATAIRFVYIGSIRGKREGGELANAFLVTAEVWDNSVLPKLQAGVLSLLRSNEYVKIRERHQKSYYLGMIAKVDKELHSLDSMKRALFAHRTKSFDVLLMDPTNIYKMGVELNKEKIGYQNRLELINTVQLVEGFTAYDKPYFPKLSFNLGVGACLGIVVLALFYAYQALMTAIDLSKKKLEQS